MLLVRNSKIVTLLPPVPVPGLFMTNAFVLPMALPQAIRTWVGPAKGKTLASTPVPLVLIPVVLAIRSV